MHLIFSIFLTIRVYTLGLNIVLRWKFWFVGEDGSGNGMGHVYWLCPEESKDILLGAGIPASDLKWLVFHVRSIGHGSEKSNLSNKKKKKFFNAAPKWGPTWFLSQFRNSQVLILHVLFFQT